MTHKHIAMEANFEVTDFTRKTARGSWWLSVTPPTMPSFVEVFIEYIASAQSFVPWPAQLYLCN